jgi:subtilisin family serine protease
MMTDSLLAVGMLRTRLTRIAWASVLLALSACGGGGGSATPPSPPVASATANITQGQAPLTVNFDASKSTDPQNFPLMYTWTFGDGSTATGATVAHVFQNHGSYTASVAVSDGHNTTNSSPIAIAVTPAPPTVQPTAIPVNVMGVAPTTAAATVSATDRENLTLTYSISAPPTAGTASIDSNTGVITYVVAGYASTPTDTFTVKVANLGASATGTVNVTLNGDPLLPNQWHIQNTGQNAFSTTLPVAGNDMNVSGAWTAGYSGKGIKVGVVDSGLEAAHEDLAANVDLTHSWNFITGTNDPTRQATDVGDDHGTQVAGIIGAVAFNGKGGRGVAYNATLRGYNLTAPATPFTVANFGKAMGSDPISADNDLFNASFEAAQGFSLPVASGAYQSITGTTLTLRANLGASIVNAAGNDFVNLNGAPAGACNLANQYGVGCGDTAGDERRGGYAPIIVAALNANGVHATYSNTGASLWISAPGGEYGGDSSVIPAQFFSQFADPVDAIQPAIVTTARTGCANASQSFFNQLPPVSMNTLDDQGANPLASQCQYTAQMNGTSSATPNTAGTVAMMLEANPKLSVRDLKYILAKTAKHVDPGFSGVAATNIISGSTVTLEQGWVTNAAGYSFSNRYGFGGVDSAAAVAMAKTYSSFLPPLQNSTGNYSFLAAAPATIPPKSALGGSINYAVSEAFGTVEFVVVFVSISSTPGMLCNQIELTSPSGTKSILMHAANGFQNSSVPFSRIESNAFYGEPVNGTWKLTFFDFCTASGTSTALSTTQAQILSIAGH